MVSKLLEFSWMESMALVRVANFAVSPPLEAAPLPPSFSILAEIIENTFNRYLASPANIYQFDR